jgi:hypothetical protein
VTGSTRAEIREVALPDFGMPSAEPTLPASLHAERVARLRARMDRHGLDHVVVWGDREHSANIAYLTGFDPRFEEALVLIGTSGDPVVLAGNECFGLAQAAPLPMRVARFQDFSLPGQARDSSAPLGDILRDAGIAPGSHVGTIGWKTYAARTTIELPSFVVDELRAITGAGGSVENVNELMIDAGDGLRTVNEPEQLAAFEWAACQTSQGVRDMIAGLRPGMTEREAVRLLSWGGSPLSCHLMLTAGPRARFGLLSPGDRRIERGDPLTVAFGIWGALNCRAGFVVEHASELADGIGDYVERLVVPYFRAVAEWYSALHVGQVGGALQAVVDRHLGDAFFGVSLNPGHQLHLDEWVGSPVFPGSTIELQSGAALQCDIIPSTGTPYFTTNVEDGVALADESLRSVLATRYPEMWARIEARRRFMVECLGFDLHPDVLPFSNMPAHLPPFLLSPHQAMTIAR